MWYVSCPICFYYWILLVKTLNFYVIVKSTIWIFQIIHIIYIHIEKISIDITSVGLAPIIGEVRCTCAATEYPLHVNFIAAAFPCMRGDLELEAL